MSSAFINDDLLNFCFFSANFYKFIDNSSKNFVATKKKEKEKAKLEVEKNTFEDNFELLNKENYFKYLDNLSFLYSGDINTKNHKINLINSFIGNNFFQNNKKMKMKLLFYYIN